MAAAVVLSSCGGGGGDATNALDRAFKHPIDSADLKLQLDIDVQRDTSTQPIRFQATGPFRTNGRKLPSANLSVAAGTPGGQTISTGFLSTGDRLFVKFQDVYYEQPRAVVSQTNRNFKRDRSRNTSPTGLGLHPRSWLKEAKSKGSSQVAGVATEHVSGKLDVANLVRDFNRFLLRSGSAIGSATGQPVTPALTSAEIKRIVDFVKDPNFDVYVGKRDGILRRIAGQVKLHVPDRDSSQLRGLKGGTIQFSVEFDNVNGHQRIQAPSNARPLSELRQFLGGAAPPPTGTIRPDALKKYAQCLDRSKPGDTDAIQRCTRLLR
jgi:hypothetical protein